jgi:hypothetical protein
VSEAGKRDPLDVERSPVFANGAEVKRARVHVAGDPKL